MMMSCRGGAESHQNNNVREKSFRIRHDDLKLFSRFLSRQETSNRSSFRVYYGDVSVPFVWESQPGTPKHRFAADDGAALRPPLTPPPSYYCNSEMTTTAAGSQARKKTVLPGSILLRALLTKVSLRRTKSAAAAAPSPSPSFSLSSSSSSLSSFSATSTPSSFRGRRARRFSGSGSSFDKGIEGDIAKAEPSPACCGIIDMERSIIVKKVLFSIVGRRQNLN